MGRVVAARFFPDELKKQGVRDAQRGGEMGPVKSSLVEDRLIPEKSALALPPRLPLEKAPLFL
jgi:hypothetical protein